MAVIGLPWLSSVWWGRSIEHLGAAGVGLVLVGIVALAHAARTARGEDRLALAVDATRTAFVPGAGTSAAAIALVKLVEGSILEGQILGTVAVFALGPALLRSIDSAVTVRTGVRPSRFLSVREPDERRRLEAAVSYALVGLGIPLVAREVVTNRQVATRVNDSVGIPVLRTTEWGDGLALLGAVLVATGYLAVRYFRIGGKPNRDPWADIDVWSLRIGFGSVGAAAGSIVLAASASLHGALFESLALAGAATLLLAVWLRVAGDLLPGPGTLRRRWEQTRR